MGQSTRAPQFMGACGTRNLQCHIVGKKILPSAPSRPGAGRLPLLLMMMKLVCLCRVKIPAVTARDADTASHVVTGPCRAGPGELQARYLAPLRGRIGDLQTLFILPSTTAYPPHPLVTFLSLGILQLAPPRHGRARPRRRQPARLGTPEQPCAPRWRGACVRPRAVHAAPLSRSRAAEEGVRTRSRGPMRPLSSGRLRRPAAPSDGCTGAAPHPRRPGPPGRAVRGIHARATRARLRRRGRWRVRRGSSRRGRPPCRDTWP
jgi:hypothetical protein